MSSWTAMGGKERERWERNRAKGMLRFILLYGVLGWGGLTATLMAVSLGFFSVRSAPESLADYLILY